MTDTWISTPKAITLVREDLAASRAFYEALLGQNPIFAADDSAVFTLGATMVNLLACPSMPDLVAPDAVAAPGGVRAVCTLGVESVDAAADMLALRGIALRSGPVDRPWGIRTINVANPSGHVRELAQDL